MPPPTTRTTNITTCTACLDPLQGPHLLVDTNAICHACFRHLFTIALSSESSYPASWAGHPLSASRYAHILGPELLDAYEAKATEYACPAQERVFCSRTDPPRRPELCGRFVGQWREARVHACVKCESCAWYTCLRCEESFSTSDVAGAETAIKHECDPTRDREFEERAFRGLKRGREWQLCPNERCTRRVELSDGCNHVRCVCRMHFCFICGMPFRDGEGHWRKEGGCPRFGQRDSERAIYDEHDAWDDNGDLEDDERAREMQRLEDEDEKEVALRRAFDLQMRLVEEMRRDLEETEAARLENRECYDEEVAIGALRRRQRIRRRRPREGQEKDDARRRAEEHQRQAPDGRERRRPRGIRAFIDNAIDATERALLGVEPQRHR